MLKIWFLHFPCVFFVDDFVIDFIYSYLVSCGESKYSYILLCLFWILSGWVGYKAGVGNYFLFFATGHMTDLHRFAGPGPQKFCWRGEGGVKGAIARMSRHTFVDRDRVKLSLTPEDCWLEIALTSRHTFVDVWYKEWTSFSFSFPKPISINQGRWVIS